MLMLYFGFQKLEIYQLSKELVKDIYKLSSSFPSDEPSHDIVFDTHADNYNSWHGQKYKTGVWRAPSDLFNQIINF